MTPSVFPRRAGSKPYRTRISPAEIGVLTVIDEEFDEIAPILGTTQNIPGTQYYVREGQAGPYDIVLAQLAGRGNVKAATAAIKLIEDFRPPYIILVGVAGGIKDRDGTGIADVVVPNFIDYYEIRKLDAGKSLRRMEPHDHPGCALLHNFAIPVARKKDWIRGIDQTRRPDQDGRFPEFRTGYLISGEKVLGDDDAEVQRHLLTEFDKAIAVDMESFGVAEAVFSTRSRHYSPQFLVVRGISDLIRELEVGQKAQGEALAGKKNNAVRQAWKPYAAHAAAVFARAVIESVLDMAPSVVGETK
jgi:nucleoside phosphorylase